MSITIPKSTPPVQLEAGTYPARCYSMVHIGTIEYEWNGQRNKANKVRITFEFPTETNVFKEGDEAKPFVISQEYTLSFGKQSKFRPQLEAWRGKPFTEEEMDNFDLTKLIGVPAMVTVIQNDKGYSEIAQITKMPKGMVCPDQVNKSVILDYNDNWNQEVFNDLPDFIKTKMQTTPEFQAKVGKTVGGSGVPYPTNEIDAGSIPF